MWIVGDWGQASPWTRASGVRMTKGDDDVWTGELSLPKGTKFDIKILKSTDGLYWSAVRYASTLNISASHDFGEFTVNLIPNGNFDEENVKWTPAEAIRSNNQAVSKQKVAVLQLSESITSDAFVIPPSQTLRLTGYYAGGSAGKFGTVLIQVVSPRQEVLSERKLVINNAGSWKSFSETFTTGGIPLECSVRLTNNDSTAGMMFDSLSLVSP